MATFDPNELPVQRFHAHLVGAVTPRPIAFASTVDRDGQVNLSPFSFFNFFGSNPPVLVFSPTRRRDSSTKHTYQNVMDVPEVVINIVNYAMVQQASLASTDYPRGVSEFIKAGFTEKPSVKVKPPRVAESPVSMECKVTQVIQTGTGGAAANLVICQVLLMHISDEVLDDEGVIDPFKLDAVGRLGREWYCRVQGSAIFRVPRPGAKIAIGIDQLPESIRRSRVLTGNDLGLLATVEQIPEAPERVEDERLRAAQKQGTQAVHRLARHYLKEGKVREAWAILLAHNVQD